MRLIMPRAKQKSLLDGKIMELDEMVANSVIIEENLNTNTAVIGSTVLLQDLDCGKECRYNTGRTEGSPTLPKVRFLPFRLSVKLSSVKPPEINSRSLFPRVNCILN